MTFFASASLIILIFDSSSYFPRLKRRKLRGENHSFHLCSAISTFRVFFLSVAIWLHSARRRVPIRVFLLRVFLFGPYLVCRVYSCSSFRFSVYPCLSCRICSYLFVSICCAHVFFCLQEVT